MATILVFDDDEVNLALLRAVIADAGHELIGAPKLEDVPPDARPNLVITDLIPLKAYRRETALWWISTLRARFREAPVLVITAHADALAEPDKLGADALIGKPFDVAAVLATIDALLGAGGRSPPTVTS